MAEIAVTRKVLGDARERDGECPLFLLTAAGSCEVAYPETRSPGWKSASVGRASPLPFDASITGSRALENPLSTRCAGGGPPPSVVRVYIRPYHKPQQVSKVNSL